MKQREIHRDEAGIEVTQPQAGMPATARLQKARALEKTWPCWKFFHSSAMTHLSPFISSHSQVVKPLGCLDHEDTTASMG